MEFLGKCNHLYIIVDAMSFELILFDNSDEDQIVRHVSQTRKWDGLLALVGSAGLGIS
jgi:hypothetical protein